MLHSTVPTAYSPPIKVIFKTNSLDILQQILWYLIHLNYKYLIEYKIKTVNQFLLLRVLLLLLLTKLRESLFYNVITRDLTTNY